MTVEGESKMWYSYIDIIVQVEALSEFIRITIEEELASIEQAIKDSFMQV